MSINKIGHNCILPCLLFAKNLATFEH
jgi:hypothetical protein